MGVCFEVILDRVHGLWRACLQADRGCGRVAVWHSFVTLDCANQTRFRKTLSCNALRRANSEERRGGDSNPREACTPTSFRD